MNNELLMAGGAGLLHVRMIYLVRTNKKMHHLLSVFYLILVCLPGLGVSEYDICFSWSHLDEIEQ